IYNRLTVCYCYQKCSLRIRFSVRRRDQYASFNFEPVAASVSTPKRCDQLTHDLQALGCQRSFILSFLYGDPQDGWLFLQNAQERLQAFVPLRQEFDTAGHEGSTLEIEAHHPGNTGCEVDGRHLACGKSYGARVLAQDAVAGRE